VLLIALNCCYYAIDIGRLPKTAVNRENGTIVFDRQKTKTARVAVLWDRTAEAIKVYQLEYPHQLPQIFATRQGTPYDTKQICRVFQRVKKLAGISDDVKFNNLRDGAYTAAIEGGADLIHAQILAGHRTGIADAYVRRNPAMVKDACEAIERHYFG